jgi:hypothetical protein
MTGFASKRMMANLKPVEFMWKDTKMLECNISYIYGQEYFCVKPKGLNWYEMEEWCEDTMGPRAGFAFVGNQSAVTPDARWYAHFHQFWFRDLKDRAMFIMRWS